MHRKLNLIKLILLITTTCFLSTCQSAKINIDKPCNYKLELSCVENFKYTVGNGIIVYLSLKSNDIEILNNKIVQDLDGDNLLVSPSNSSGYEFRNQNNIKAKKAGKYTIGPYKLSIGNCELISNTIDIIVYEKPQTETPKFSYSESKISMKEFEEKEFFITSNFEFELNKSIQNQGFDIKVGKTSISKSIVSGVLTTTNNYSFKIIAKKAGIYRITKEYFDFLPENLDFKEIELEIKP